MKSVLVATIVALLGSSCGVTSANSGTSVVLSGEAMATLTGKPVCAPQSGAGITLAGATADGRSLTIQLSSSIQQITFNSLYYLLENPANVSVTQAGATLTNAVFGTPTNSIHEIQVLGAINC